MTPKRFRYRRVRPEFTFIGPEISLVSVEGVEVDFHKWHFDGGWGTDEYLMRHIPTQTRFLVDTGAATDSEVMTARLVEVRDDYPMPDSEQIISLGRAAIGYVYEELPDSRAPPRGCRIDPMRSPKAARRFVDAPSEAGVTSTHRRPTDLEMAGWLIAAVLSDDQAEIEPDKLAWLRRFLRERLSRPEYRVIAKVMGWTRKKTIATPHLAADHPELDDDNRP